MPTYQYACTDLECDNRFELVQSFTDAAVSECPVCHHGVRKVYGSVGVVFKGSGFYRNDSRKAAGLSESTGGSSSESGSKSDAKSSSASDSKSDSSSTKSEPKSDAKSGSRSGTDSKQTAKSASSATTST